MADPPCSKDEIEELVPLYQQPDYSDFEVEEGDSAKLAGNRLGLRRLYKGPFPSGFERFSPVEYSPGQNISGDGYQLTLLSGSILPHFGGGTRSSRASRLKRFSPHAWVEMNEADAKNFGFNDGDAVRVVSPAGKVTTTIRVTNTLPPQTLFMPISFPECPVNELFGVALDPRVKSPSLKGCSVKLERINANG